jgi:simple sugar transport system permease protein
MIKLLKKPIVGSLLAILAAIIVGGIILAVAGHNPIQVYRGLIYGALGRPRFVANTIIMSTSLILTGLSVTFAYKAGLFNIGVEGQFIIGTVAAVFLGHFFNLPPIIHPLVVMAGAMLVAGAYGAIVGFFKARFNIHEVLSSIMLNWVALHLHNLYIGVEMFQRNPTVAHPIQPSASIVFLQEMKRTPDGIARIREFESVSETAVDIILRTNLNFGIFIAIATVFIVKFILDKTTTGYTLKAVGANKDAAEFAGINVKRYTVLSMFFAGALAGLAAAVHITGITPNTINTLTSFQNMGFNGIPVALLANAGVIGNIFSALLFGGMNYGSGYVQSNYEVATEIIDIMVGLIVFFVALRAVCVMVADKINKKAVGGSAPKPRKL